ncbi:RNA polymerase sigma factor [Streptomyces sp. NPDC058284]|uniref:RNA polymerase sigma factor n=1 Tax=unclassified Streptomyces TaxID=2593676 RepID=UPI0036621ABC
MVVPVKPSSEEPGTPEPRARPGGPAADAALHRRLVHGEEAALAEAYAAYGPLVRRVAARVTRDHAAAEDVAQEVFAHLWSRPYAYDARHGGLRVRLSMLAHRRAVDWVRGEERHRKAVPADGAAPRAVPAPGHSPDGRSPDGAVVEQERSLLLHSALTRLPPSQQQVMHLAHFAGRTYRQAAVELGIPEGAVKSGLRAALGTLTETLADPPPRGERP